MDDKTILQGPLEGGRRRDWQKELLDGQRQRMNVPAHARTTHDSLLQKRLDEDLF